MNESDRNSRLCLATCWLAPCKPRNDRRRRDDQNEQKSDTNRRRRSLEHGGGLLVESILWNETRPRPRQMFDANAASRQWKHQSSSSSSWSDHTENIVAGHLKDHRVMGIAKASRARREHAPRVCRRA